MFHLSLTTPPLRCEAISGHGINDHVWTRFTCPSLVAMCRDPPSSAILISYWVWQEVFVTSSNFDAL